MNRIAYYRVSTSEQSIESQRSAMGGGFTMEFSDKGVSGGVPAAQRPGFAAMLQGLTDNTTVYVYAVDRLGRDAIDVQVTVRQLAAMGVTVHVHGLGLLVGDAGTLILAVFAQMAEMERKKINERTEAGRQAARESLAATGFTHHGATSLGRPPLADATTVSAWRNDNSASFAKTAKHFGLSDSTVKRYCKPVVSSDSE